MIFRMLFCCLLSGCSTLDFGFTKIYVCLPDNAEIYYAINLDTCFYMDGKDVAYLDCKTMGKLKHCSKLGWYKK